MNRMSGGRARANPSRRRTASVALALGTVLALASGCGGVGDTEPADAAPESSEPPPATESSEPTADATEASEPTADATEASEPPAEPDVECAIISVDQISAPMVGDWKLNAADEMSCEFGNTMTDRQILLVTVVPVGEAPVLTDRRSPFRPDQVPEIEPFEPPGTNGSWVRYTHEDVVWGMYFEVDDRAVLIEEYSNAFNGEWRDLQETIMANLAA